MGEGGLAAFFPAAALVGDGRKPAGAVLALALEAVEGGAGFGIGGARLGVAAARGRDIVGQRDAITELLEFGLGGAARFHGGIVALGEAADLGFERGKLRGAFGGGAGGLGREILRRDQRLVGVAFFAFGGAFGFAGGMGGVARGRPGREHGRAMFLGAFDLAVQRGEAVSLRQAHRGGRGRVGGRGIAIPAPQIAARRDQPLAGLELRLKRLALVGEHDAGHREAARQCGRALHEIAERPCAVGQRGALVVISAQIAPVMRRGLVERRLEIVAQRGGEGGFVARLHLHGIDQRREQVLALRTE